MPLYAETSCVNDIKERFAYVFRQTQQGGGKPHFEMHTVSGFTEEQTDPTIIDIAGRKIIPIPLFHGDLPVCGWRCGDTAYLTDCNKIPEKSFSLLKGVKKLIIDALRLRPHSTHFNFISALEQIDRIAPEQAWFTHICHDFSHVQIEEWLRTNAAHYLNSDKKIEPAYDGLHIPIECKPL